MMGWSLGRDIEQFNILSRGRCGPVLVSSPQTMINCATGFDTSAKIEKRWRIELLSKTKRSDVKARKEDTKIWTETNCWMNSGLDFTGSFPFFSIFYCGFKPWNFNFKVFSFLPTFFSYQVSGTVVISSYNVHQPQDHVKKKFHPPKLVIVTLVHWSSQICDDHLVFTPPLCWHVKNYGWVGRRWKHRSFTFVE